MILFRIFTVGDWRKRYFETGPGWLTVWRLLNSLPVRAVLTALMRESFGMKRFFRNEMFLFFFEIWEIGVFPAKKLL